MKIGIGIPNSIPGTEGRLLVEWARRAEALGFSSLSTIGRVAYPSFEELTTLAAWVACIADARSIREYTEILAGAGLRVTGVEARNDAIARMIDQIEARLAVLRMTAADRLTQAGVDVDAVLRYAALAKQAVANGLLGYALLVAEKP